jgi:hypothetical protein
MQSKRCRYWLGKPGVPVLGTHIGVVRQSTNCNDTGLVISVGMTIALYVISIVNRSNCYLKEPYNCFFAKTESFLAIRVFLTFAAVIFSSALVRYHLNLKGCLKKTRCDNVSLLVGFVSEFG